LRPRPPGPIILLCPLTFGPPNLGGVMLSKLAKRVSHVVMIKLLALMEVLGVPGGKTR